MAQKSWLIRNILVVYGVCLLAIALVVAVCFGLHGLPFAALFAAAGLSAIVVNRFLPTSADHAPADYEN